MADGRGRFLFHNVPKGAVTLSVSADGYMAGGYGQRRPNGGTVPLELGEGQRIPEVTIRLWKFGALGGTIVDEFDGPVVGVQVRILQVLRGVTQRRVIEVAKAATDDRGAFRVSSLVPGDYIVSVPTTATPTSESAAEDRPRYETTFYPEATTASQAEIITIGSGQERSGVDIALRVVRTLRVSGSASGPDGPASRFALHLVPADAADWGGQGGFETARTLTDDQGRFTFVGVPPGQYLLRGTAWSPVAVPDRTDAGAMTSLTSLWGQASVSVDEGDVTGVSLALRDGLSVGGRLRFVGSSRPPTPDQLQELSISLTSATGTNLGPEAPGRVAPDGEFTIRGYLPGQYAVNVSSVDGPWTLQSMTASGLDLLRVPLSLDSDVSGVVVTFTDRPTQLSGAVHGSLSKDERLTVVVFPADYAAAEDNGMFDQRARSLPLGAALLFTIDGLPAGDYLIAAIPSDLAADWTAPDLVAVIASQANRVTLADGDRKTVDPRVVRTR